MIARYVVAVLIAVTPLVQAASIIANVADQSGQPVKDAVISVSSPAVSGASSSRGVIVDQINKEFVPHVKTVQVGSTVNFPNKDNIRHHVYSFSPAKTFELPLYEGTPAQPELFDKVGVVILGCNIHDWMRAYVYVVDTPYTATTDANGRASLNELPAGSYHVQVWHPRFAQATPLVKPVLLTEKSKESLVFSVNIKRAIKIRRAPGRRNRSGY